MYSRYYAIRDYRLKNKFYYNSLKIYFDSMVSKRQMLADVTI